MAVSIRLIGGPHDGLTHAEENPGPTICFNPTVSIVPYGATDDYDFPEGLAAPEPDRYAYYGRYPDGTLAYRYCRRT